MKASCVDIPQFSLAFKHPFTKHFFQNGKRKQYLCVSVGRIYPQQKHPSTKKH